MPTQTKENPLKVDDQYNNISSFKAFYNELPRNMSNNNKVSTKFEISKIEVEETMKMKKGEFKYETLISIYMKLLILNLNKSPSSYDKT